MNRLTLSQREALAIIAGHPEAVTFSTIQQLEMMGLVGGEGFQLQLTELGKLVLAREFGNHRLSDNKKPRLQLVTPELSKMGRLGS